MCVHTQKILYCQSQFGKENLRDDVHEGEKIV